MLLTEEQLTEIFTNFMEEDERGFTNDRTGNDIDALENHIKALQEEVEKYKWLKVDGKLENGRYLCYVRDLFHNSSNYMRLLWLDGKFPWIKNREPQYEVTAYMSLPAPPDR